MPCPVSSEWLVRHSGEECRLLDLLVFLGYGPRASSDEKLCSLQERPGEGKAKRASAPLPPGPA